MPITRSKGKIEQVEDIIDLQKVKQADPLITMNEQEMKELKSAIKAIQSGQDSLRTMMEREVAGLKISISASINESVKKLQDTFDMEINSLKDHLKQVEQRLTNLEKQSSPPEPEPEPYDPNYTVVVFGLQHEQGENVEEKAKSLVHDQIGLRDIAVVRSLRTPTRNGKPGVVKIQFASVDEKIKVLQNKRELKNCSRQYQNVYIRTSKSHLERLYELNFKNLLRGMPNGNDYRITGNGRLVKRNDQQDGATGTDGQYMNGRPPSY
jgi:exonuclease VII small subunit